MGIYRAGVGWKCAQVCERVCMRCERLVAQTLHYHREKLRNFGFVERLIQALPLN